MKIKLVLLTIVIMGLVGCEDYLTPRPVDQLSDELIIVDARSANAAIGGMYRTFTPLVSLSVIAGDFMADNLKHNGTFTDFSQMNDKTMNSASNQALETWEQIYSLVYICNFILEKVPTLSNITQLEADSFVAQARFFRGYAYFIGINTFGDMPFVTSTLVTENRNIGKTSTATIIDAIEADLLAALEVAPVISENDPYFLTNGAVKAMLARFYLFTGDNVKAEDFATEVIDGVGAGSYSLASTYATAIAEESSESILEVYYDNVDNPATNNSYGLWNLFAARREIIPSDEVVSFLQGFGGDRFNALSFNAALIGDRDNGYTIARYGTNGSNVPVLRLAEMYLIRAEARALQNDIAGGLADLNELRSNRGFASDLVIASQGPLLNAIADERRAEHAFEGHRWYDLKRTGQAATVLGSIPGWDNTDLLYPIPQYEILYNAGLTPADQNPGY